MRPVVEKSSAFITFAEVDVSMIDLLDDAWGFTRQYPEQFHLLSLMSPSVPDYLLNELICRVNTLIDPDTGTTGGGVD